MKSKTGPKHLIVKRKQFEPRESLLTILIENNPHVSTLHNLIIAVILFSALATIGDYISNPHKFTRDFAILAWNFQDFYPHFVFVWTALQAHLMLLLYPLVYLRHKFQENQVIAHVKQNLKQDPDPDEDKLDNWLDQAQNRVSSRLEDFAFGCIHASLLCSMIFLTTSYILTYHLSMVCSFALTMELCRMLMKAQSYYVEKSLFCPEKESLRKLVKDEHDLARLNQQARYTAFIYFLFAPTLIYRDTYPRTDRIRWFFVATHALQMVLVCLASFVMIVHFLIEPLSSTGHQAFHWTHIFSNLNSLAIFGLIIFMFTFYGFLHVWHNMTAELLRFADRHYYDAWWDSISLSEYYRKWNHLVQEWLFAYIYVPIANRFENRLWASFSVILVSGLAHEYVVSLTIKFFFPVLFFSFAVNGFIFYLLTKNLKRKDTNSKVYNMIFWLSIILGWGLLSSAYSIEWYSRTNCPTQNSTLTNFFIPRWMHCVRIER